MGLLLRTGDGFPTEQVFNIFAIPLIQGSTEHPDQNQAAMRNNLVEGYVVFGPNVVSDSFVPPYRCSSILPQ